MENECPIWGKSPWGGQNFEKDPFDKTKIYPSGLLSSFKGYQIDGSFRDLPPYQVTEDVMKYLLSIKDPKHNPFKAKLSTWLVKQRRLNHSKMPIITKDVLEQIKKTPRLPIDERINNFLNFIYKQNNNESFSAYHRGHLYTHAEIANKEEWDTFIEHLCKYNFIKIIFNCEDDFHLSLTIAVEGIKRLESLSTNKDSKDTFVAMWFDPSMDKVYNQAIEPAIRETGFNPIRIDQAEHINKIDDEIIANIKRSKFLIADFSHNKKTGARGGVYYEAGFAHGLGIPVIFTCKKENEEDLHFDTRQYNHIIYNKNELEDFKKRLINRIDATIKNY